MTIYDAGPLAAGPLCGLLIVTHFRILEGPAIRNANQGIDSRESIRRKTPIFIMC